MERIGVVFYPDWPIHAAGHHLDKPVAITAKKRIYACSPAARRYGITVGMPVSQAEALCPQLPLFSADAARNHAQFTTIAEHCTNVTPFVHILRPGLLQFTSRHLPSHHETPVPFVAVLQAALDAALPAHKDRHTLPRPYRIGIADTTYAALVAAYTSDAFDQVRIVPAGHSAAFLADQPIDMLALLALCHNDLPKDTVLQQFINDCQAVGVTTCGALLALPARAVADRFGKIAAPLQDTLRAALTPFPTTPYIPQERRFTTEFAPALTEIAAVTFAVRRLFEEALTAVADTGQACYEASIEIVTENNDRSVRSWQAREYFTASLLQERLRFQLEGWHAATSGPPPSAGVTRVTLSIEQTVTARQQPTLLYDASDDARTALLDTAVSRIDALLGEGAVTRPYRSAGRHPAQWFQTRPWQRERQPAAELIALWTNQLPQPAPATVYLPPQPITVHDASDTPVVVSGRGMLATAPHKMRFPHASWQPISAFAGPWLANERWWDTNPRRAARFQFVTDSGQAYLVAQTRGRWFAEALYD